MAEQLSANIEGAGDLESTTVWVNRTSTTVKGGRRMSFSALVVVGDRRGRVGIGYAGAPGVPAAIEKAQKEARKHLVNVVVQDGTFPHPVQGKFGASSVKLVPASPGTGVVAGGTVRAVLEMVGVRDALTKAYGSTNKINLTKATFDALSKLRMRNTVADLRGLTIETSSVDEMLEKGKRYAPKVVDAAARQAKGPVSKVQSARGGRRGGGGGGGGRGRRGGGEQQQQQAPTESAAAGNAPASDAPAAPPAQA